MSETQWPNRDIKVEMFDAVRGADGNPVQPVRLKDDDKFSFSCHRGVPCWNVCCHGADITLSPMDILRISRHFGVNPGRFLAEYTVPAMWGATNLPVAKLKMGGAEGKGPCPFMVESGCSVYGDRPLTCRYYPLGLATVKMKGDADKHDFHFLVKESHCKGHQADGEQTVLGFKEEQGIDAYQAVNRGWMDILMKTSSWASAGGPFGKDIPV
ncbi:MAG: YkgJ family cysteine cluster protein, partial [Rhodospirillales bacterium]